MFNTLKSKLADVFDGLARRGSLSESDVDAALREVRLALLDADVALPAVKAFTEKVRQQAVGVASMRAVRPDQQVIKIVHDVDPNNEGTVVYEQFLEIMVSRTIVLCDVAFSSYQLLISILPSVHLFD